VRQKKRRKRKQRLPKDFDPANPGPPPDPERWLPKWQRADFKKKRNRRREKVCACVCLLGVRWAVLLQEASGQAANAWLKSWKRVGKLVGLASW
jgi:SRP72 RNA-binding domain